MDARKQQLETSFASVSVISWAFADTTLLESKYLNCIILVQYLEGFVHASTKIWLGSLKRVLPESKKPMLAKSGVEAAFQEVTPKDYMCHPTIKTFLEKTSLDPLDSDKRKLVHYRRSSASNFEPVNAKTWFGRGTMICQDPSQLKLTSDQRMSLNTKLRLSVRMK